MKWKTTFPFGKSIHLFTKNQKILLSGRFHTEWRAVLKIYQDYTTKLLISIHKRDYQWLFNPSRNRIQKNIVTKNESTVAQDLCRKSWYISFISLYDLFMYFDKNIYHLNCYSNKNQILNNCMFRVRSWMITKWIYMDDFRVQSWMNNHKMALHGWLLWAKLNE